MDDIGSNDIIVIRSMIEPADTPYLEARPLFIYLAMIDSPDEKQKFEIIYQTYRQLMFYIANRILENAQDAEDVVHEAFLKVIENMGKINNPRCPQTRAFVVTITENKAIDLYRRRKNHSVVPLEDEYIGVPELSEIEQVEESDILTKAILSLPGRYREVLFLKYAQGYSMDEIAVLLSTTGENVKKLIQRARKKLEEVLEGEAEP